jgi:hypothetical protein
MVRLFLKTDTEDLLSGEIESLSSELNLVDLAGSETLETGERATEKNTNESKNINKSLGMLTTVIRNLTESAKHVGYRNSKLTQILANSLGGNAQTALIGTISPLFDLLGSSKKTLDFLKIAKRIKNTPFKRKQKHQGSKTIITTTVTSKEIELATEAALEKQKAGMEHLAASLLEQSAAYHACKLEKEKLETHVAEMVLTSQKLSDELTKFQATTEKQTSLITNLQSEIAEKNKTQLNLLTKIEALTKEKEASTAEFLIQISNSESDLRKERTKLNDLEMKIETHLLNLQICQAQRENDKTIAEKKLEHALENNKTLTKEFEFFKEQSLIQETERVTKHRRAQEKLMAQIQSLEEKKHILPPEIDKQQQQKQKELEEKITCLETKIQELKVKETQYIDGKSKIIEELKLQIISLESALTKSKTEEEKEREKIQQELENKTKEIGKLQ